jgi:hypothetical protein
MAAIAAPADAKKPPDTWDGLLLVASKKFDVAYLAPGADFRVYNKVMIDPTEASFRKNWQKNFNAGVVSLDRRISDEEARKMLAAVQTGLQESFIEAYKAAGVQVVTTPGPDVLRLRTAVINLDVSAPDQMTMSRGANFSAEAGTATLVLEARDSMSGAVLARGVDQREVGDTGFMVRRTSVENRSDFERTFKAWAKLSIEALANIRSMPPIDSDGKPQQVAAAGPKP